MAEFPRASIIINNYNYGRFLCEAIESALEQTYAHTEVIVVDDGSTDNSRRVIESFGDRIVAVLKENGGQGSAYNVGFRASSGHVVTFLDADDTLFPEAIETAALLLREPNVVKVQWPLQVVNAVGDWRGEFSTKQEPPAGDLRVRAVDEGPIYDFHYHAGSAYCRHFLASASPVPEAPYRNGADVYFVTLAPVFGLVRTATHALGTYRAHGSNNYRDRLLNVPRVKNCIERFEANARSLHLQLARQGVLVDRERWRQRNFNYLWPSRLLSALGDIESVVPAGARYLLVDNCDWGMRDLVPERTAVPFVEKDGQYWGPPEDDASAIEELSRQCEQDVRFLVIWWTCFWWFEAYPEFAEHLRSQHSRVVDNERVRIFKLSGPSLVDRSTRRIASQRGQVAGS